MRKPVSKVAVVGAGTMGSGITQLAATHGCGVTLVDLSADLLERALSGIFKQLDRLVEKAALAAPDRDAVRGRIRASADLAEIGDVELAVEAVTEDLSVKQKIFSALDTHLPADAVLATNTSSLSVGRIAEAVRDPGRVVGMHFFNPAPIMPLVEIVAAQRSTPCALDIVTVTAQSWGKTTVQAKDTPGFIVNRVARGFYLEALRLLDEGVAGIDEIDGIMRRHGGFKMGPFELMDLVGLDVNYAVSTSVWEQLGKPARLEPHPIQRQLVERKHLGRKSGRGFYVYGDGRAIPAVPIDRKSFAVSPLLSEAVRVFCERGGMAGAGATEQFVIARILGAVLNEAGIVSNEGVATEADIDTAMLKGTNYPRGPLEWANQIGHRTVRGVLNALNGTSGNDRYAPAPFFSL